MQHYRLLWCYIEQPLARSGAQTRVGGNDLTDVWTESEGNGGEQTDDKSSFFFDHRRRVAMDGCR